VRVSTRAPAKVNWTLEVLGRRPDGYHEVRTILQTVDLCDQVRVSPAGSLELVPTGPAVVGGPPPAEVPAVENLAYRAAALLRDRAGVSALGARIELAKAIPVGAGLGGGSSDAAATLRALDRLWEMGLPPAALARLGAELGADVPFFLFGGTALARGRGDDVAPLPDIPPQRLLLVAPRDRPARPAGGPAGKTAAMYAHLRPEHFSGGEGSERLAAAIAQGVAPGDDDVCNTFEGIVAGVLPQAVAAAERCRALGLRPHLAGSGPAQFVILPPEADSASLREALRAAGLDVFETATLAASAAAAVEEEP